MTAGAEAAFASYIARVQRGEKVDFAGYCAERPGLALDLVSTRFGTALRYHHATPSRSSNLTQGNPTYQIYRHRPG